MLLEKRTCKKQPFCYISLIFSYIEDQSEKAYLVLFCKKSRMMKTFWRNLERKLGKFEVLCSVHTSRFWSSRCTLSRRKRFRRKTLSKSLYSYNKTLDNKVTFFLVQSIRISIHKNQTWRVESTHLSQSERLGERNSNGKALTPEGPNKILDQEFHIRNIDRNSST